MRGEAGFGGDHMRGSLGAMRGSSARGQRRRRLLGGRASFQRAVGLDVTRGSPETDGALIQGAVDADMPELPALKAGLIVSGVVMDERCVMVTTGPPDFGVLKSSFFFSGQGG